MVLHEVPGQVLQRHQKTVGDGLGRIVGDDMPGLEAAIGVIGLFRFGRDHLRLRRQRRERQAGARDHAAAADRGDDEIEPVSILDQFLRARPLPRDHPGIVVGMDEIAPGLGLHPGECRLAGRGRGFAFGDLAAIAAHGILLGLRRGARHDHVAGNAPQHRRVAQAGGVVAARMGGHPGLRLRVRQPEDRVRCTPDLEGAGFLEVLAFEEELSPGQLVQIVRGPDRRAADVRPDAIVRIKHVLIGRDLHGGLLHAAARFAGAPWR